MIKLDTQNVKGFFSEVEYNEFYFKTKEAFNALTNKTGLGNEYLGWLDLPCEIDLEDIINTASLIRSKCRVLVVVGIGGSYLGARAVIDANKKYFNNDFEVLFCGKDLSSDYLNDLLEYLSDKDFCINVISKSGTTTEPAIAFRILKQFIESKYEDCSDRIFVTTDKEVGALKQLATSLNYKTFEIPDSVGGRFSVLSAVGLLPIACSGIDIKELINGAIDMKNNCLIDSDAFNYALLRNVLYSTKDIELLVTYEPKLNLLSEWWKQLFGESEGKDNKGLFVASATFSTDLHSMGQMIQDGKRNLFETVIKINKSNNEILIPFDKENLDELNYLQNKSLDFVTNQATLGTTLAHVSGGVPNIVIEIDGINPYTIGELIYFFEFSCGLSGYVLGVNPFDQPGVETYKRNMFALLDKSGYEYLKKTLLK